MASNEKGKPDFAMISNVCQLLIPMWQLQLREVAKLISSVFNAQIFGPGFVHCDPHEANVLLREHPLKKGKPQIVLVDHGLYKKLDEDFQESYARLWKGIVMADIPEIKSSCEQLGVHKMASKYVYDILPIISKPYTHPCPH